MLRLPPLSLSPSPCPPVCPSRSLSPSVSSHPPIGLSFLLTLFLFLAFTLFSLHPTVCLCLLSSFRVPLSPHSLHPTMLTLSLSLSSFLQSLSACLSEGSCLDEIRHPRGFGICQTREEREREADRMAKGRRERREGEKSLKPRR